MQNVKNEPEQIVPKNENLPRKKKQKNPISSPQRISTRASIKKDEKIKIEVKRASKKIKKTNAVKKNIKKQFFEDEADEGETEEEKSQIKENGYTKEQLLKKAERLDTKMLDDMEIKYKDLEDLDDQEMKILEKQEGTAYIKSQMKAQDIADEDEAEDMSRDIYLPSIKDSKLWRIKVTPGKERELVLKITNKLIDFLNNGNPLNVLEVFECQLSAGVIYCEAYKSQHVEKVLQGLSNVNFRSVQMIPINEMTEVMKGCQVVQKQKFQEHQWVRIKGGIYKDDLGLIETTEGNRRAMVRLIPRIPESFYTDQNQNLQSLRQFGRKSKFIRIPQQLFNPLRVKNECQREYYKAIRKNFYVWRNMMFRNGYLYQEFASNKLMTENVCPSLQEVKMFQVDTTTQSHTYEYEDEEQDEWDLLDDKTLLKTIRDDPQLSIQIGDRVKVTQDQFKNCKGFIKHITDGYVHFMTEERKPFEVKAKAFQVKKCFKIGEMVRVIQGNRSGQQGIISTIYQNSEGIDTHATITMIDDSNASDITVLINNLRLKMEVDPNTQAAASNSVVMKYPSRITYVAGELIMYENHQKMGLIISTTVDALKVLNTQNKFDNVKMLAVSRKVDTKARINQTVDCGNNAIARHSIVKIKDKRCPLLNQIGDIRALYKDFLFLWIKNPILANSNGFYCVTAKQVLNAGAQHLKDANERAGHLPQEFQANIDRNSRDPDLMRGQLVQITRGYLKGYKGSIVNSSETMVEVHVHSKCAKVSVPREQIFVIFNEYDGIRMEERNNAPVYLSFDEAANKEFVNIQEEEDGIPVGNAAGFTNRINTNVQKDFDQPGDQTPVGSLLGAEEVNNETEAAQIEEAS